MPDRHSTPRQPSSIARTTNASQSSPGATVAVTAPQPSSSTRIPSIRTSTTVPSKPSSGITTLLPPPSTSTGSPRSSQPVTSASRAASSCTSTSRFAGPPSRSVVSSANGVAMRSTIVDDDRTGHAEDFLLAAGDRQVDPEPAGRVGRLNLAGHLDDHAGLVIGHDHGLGEPAA